MNKMSRIVLVSLMTVTANAAVTISTVGSGSGYDEANISGFRSMGVAKGFDVDLDDVYGTEGTFFFGQGGGANINGQPFSRHTDPFRRPPQMIRRWRKTGGRNNNP